MTTSNRLILRVWRMCTNWATVKFCCFAWRAWSITVHGLPSGVNNSALKSSISFSVKPRCTATCLQFPTPLNDKSSFLATACRTSFGSSWKEIDGLLSSVIKGSTGLASVVSFQLVTQILCQTDHTTGETILKWHYFV